VGAGGASSEWVRRAVARGSAGHAAALVLVAIAVLGCSAPIAGTARSQPEATAPRPGSSPATAPLATLPAAADGTGVGACVDGDCEILVSARTEISMDGTLRVDRLSIAVDVGKVTIRAFSQGSMSRITTGSGGTGRLNQLAVEVVAVSDGMAVLRLSPAAAR
jgi:hypothetical protein